MRELTFLELSLISGGYGECEGDGEESDICVIGHPPDLPNYPPPTPLPPSWGPPPEYGGGGGGPTPPPPPPPCEPTDGKAIDFARDTIDPTFPYGPIDPSGFTPTNPSWLHAEIIGFVGPGGQIGPTVINVGTGGWSPNFGNHVGDVQGFVHNHPPYVHNGTEYVSGSTQYLNDNRYPSTGDWNVLQAIANHYGPINGNYNPSIYLVDPFGTLREFKLSERAAIEGLSATDRQNGVGLAGREPSPPTCGH